MSNNQDIEQKYMNEEPVKPVVPVETEEPEKGISLEPEEDIPVPVPVAQGMPDVAQGMPVTDDIPVAQGMPVTDDIPVAKDMPVAQDDSINNASYSLSPPNAVFSNNSNNETPSSSLNSTSTSDQQPNQTINESSPTLWNSFTKILDKLKTTDITVIAVYIYISIIVLLYFLIGFVFTNCVYDTAMDTYYSITGKVFSLSTTAPTTSIPEPEPNCSEPTIPVAPTSTPESGPSINNVSATTSGNENKNGNGNGNGNENKNGNGNGNGNKNK